MLDSAIELLAPSAPTSLLAFCVCNMIVVILLLSSGGGGSSSNSNLPPTIEPINTCEPINYRKITIGEDDYKNEASDDNSKGKEDDELQKRAEEFIRKMNRVWKAEQQKF